MTSFLPLIICSSLYLFAMMVMIEIITTNRFGSIRYFLVGAIQWRGAHPTRQGRPTHCISMTLSSGGLTDIEYY